MRSLGQSRSNHLETRLQNHYELASINDSVGGIALTLQRPAVGLDTRAGYPGESWDITSLEEQSVLPAAHIPMDLLYHSRRMRQLLPEH